MIDGPNKNASIWRSAGVWMAILIAAFMVLNAWRSVSDPAAFVAYFGLPKAANSDPAFVYVYASRAFFLGAITAVLVWRRQLIALKYFALVAIVLPLCDASQVYAAEGFSSIVVRHLLVAVFLAVTAALLHHREQKYG